MQFNPSKCNILSISRLPPFHIFFSLCGTILQHVNEANHFGVNINDDLHWSKLVQNITYKGPSKASSTLGRLRRKLSSCPSKLREQAYISLIRSGLEYCVGIWDPRLDKDIQLLESVERRAVQFVVQDYRRYSSVASYLKDLNCTPLKDRWRDIRLSLLYKIVTGRDAVQAEGTLVPADSHARAQHTHKYRHLRATCNLTLNFFLSIPEWNSLSKTCVLADTTTAFQSRLRCCDNPAGLLASH